jgi:acyl-CoA synthetase (AMP-forming)/AMP-acid ligase II
MSNRSGPDNQTGTAGSIPPRAGTDPADLPARAIPELIGWSTGQFAELDAIRDGDTTLTYRELGQQIDRAARAMVATGIEPGDTVAVWAPNCWQWVVAGLAVSRAGALLVPINTRFKGGEAAYVLNTAKVRLLFVVDGFLDTDYSGSLAEHDLPHLDRIVDLAASAVDGQVPAGVTAEGFDTFVTNGGVTNGGVGSDGPGPVADLQVEVERRSSEVGPDDISLIMFTSGTTGNPKGVLVRGGAIIRAFYDYGRALTVQPADPYLLVNPYFHAFGYNSGIIVCLLFGAINVPVAIYEPAKVMAIIEQHKVAVFPGPPALFQGLLNHPNMDDYDLSSLRSCVTGAATIPVEMIVAMRERLGFETVITAYGMTETSGLGSYTQPDDPPEVAATTSGRAIPGGELRVVDENGVDVAVGAEGELLVRGFQVTPGYLDAPEQTAEAIDADGWLHTGDIAVMNEAGYIDITDRKKDMFIMGGFNAYPAEIERMMMEHPLVGIASVIGVPDDRMGEVGAVFVVPSPDGPPDEAELIEWCRERMANYKVPRYVWVVDDLPLNASNKVLKPQLRAKAAELLKG